jgi:hypothetical protein
MRDDDLERTLRDIGAHLDYPAPTSMANAVTARLRRPRTRVRRFGLIPGFVTAALLLALVAVLSPDARAAAGEFFHLRGVDIFPVPSVPATLPTPKIVFPGEHMTLSEARTRLRFAPLIPSAAELGQPDDVYVESVGGSDRVSLVYRQRAGIPTSPQAGVAAVIVEARGTLDENLLLGKATAAGTTVEPVTVSGARGYWIEGTPHLFFYRDANGNAVQDTMRLASNTLVWERDGITLRLEAQVSRDEAMKLAASSR